MATELLAAGGCYNSMRYAKDGAGQGARNWLAAHNIAASLVTSARLILAVCIDADDMNDADDATFKIQWENNSDDPGTWNDLADTGEIKWATDTNLIDANAVVTGEDSGGNTNCTNKGWSRRDGIEVEGKNGITHTVPQDAYEDMHWAIDLSDADGNNGDSYGFRLTQSDNTVIGTMSGLLTVLIPGKIDGITKNSDRTSVVGGVTVTAYRSDEAGSDPKPISAGFLDQVVSHVSTGVYSILAGIELDKKYFLHFYKDDTEDLSDGSPEVTAVAI
jgi:hypothetical protein